MSDLKLPKDRLPTDQYYIRNGETFAGRDAWEDLSLNPKAVTCPTDHPNDPYLFLIRQLPNGRYHIDTTIGEVSGDSTGILHGGLFAFLNDKHEAEEWVITFREVDDKHRRQYTIEKANKSGGWVKHSDEHPKHRQILVRPFKEGRSSPVPNELWNIQALVN